MLNWGFSFKLAFQNPQSPPRFPCRLQNGNLHQIRRSEHNISDHHNIHKNLHVHHSSTSSRHLHDPDVPSKYFHWSVGNWKESRNGDPVALVSSESTKHPPPPGVIIWHQPKQGTFFVGKSLKTTIHLHCLMPKKWVGLNDPCPPLPKSNVRCRIVAFFFGDGRNHHSHCT